MYLAKTIHIIKIVELPLCIFTNIVMVNIKIFNLL